MTIRLQLTLWHTALVGLVLAGFATLVYFVVARQLSVQFDYAIHLQALEASRVAHAVSLGPTGGQAHRLDVPATTAFGNKTVYVQLVDPNGRVLARSSNLPEPLPTSPTSLTTALGGEEDHVTLTMPGERLDLYSAPLLLDDRLIGVLQVAASLQPLEGSLVQLRLALAATVVIATALATTFGWILAAKAMRPVDRLTRAAGAIGRSSDFSNRLAEPRQRDEIGRLATTFNDMLARLDRVVTTQRRFLADASHALRTPVTVIRTGAETLLRAGSFTCAESRATLQMVAREADRMGRLVADLLVLARADTGQSVDRRRLALDTLLLEVYEQALTLADDVEVTFGELEQIEIEGDSDRLKQLALNLIDNAIRYTQAGGTVTIDLVRQNGGAVVRVRDTGPGIPAEHLPRIFDRFYRVDTRRSRSAGGTGLGLAICQWVAEAHGGTIAVESAVGCGSTFTVSLPFSAASAASATMAAARPTPTQALTAS